MSLIPNRIPRGIPSLTYCRIISPPGYSAKGDIQADGNSVTVIEPGKPFSRYEIAQVFDKNVTDEDVCEMSFGNQAGAGLGASLNPITACINDAVNAIIFIVGSKETKKWKFLKRTVLPFVANELFSNISDRDRRVSAGLYRAQVSLSAFQVQDEVISDLLRPGE